MQIATESELKQVIINTALDTNLTPEILEFLIGGFGVWIFAIIKSLLGGRGGQFGYSFAVPRKE